MPDDERLRVLTTPFRLTGEVRLDHLAALVSADALCRWARAHGRAAQLFQGTISGNQAAQHATERELAKEGLDRATLGRDEFVERVHQHESSVRTALADAMAALGIDVDLAQQATDAAEVSDAARVAFVRLFEEGRISLEERVVSSCPRCQTVVGAIDIEPGEAAAECHRIALVLDRDADPDRGRLIVETTAPELLPGAVAVAVPLDDPAAGTTARLPAVGRDLPVVADAATFQPRFVIPAHDAADLELARHLSLAPVAVLDVDGIVCAPGPLFGLARYAARAAIIDALAAGGDLAGSGTGEPTTEPVGRCRLCGTVLVSRLGRHWFLATTDLEVAVADKLRNEGVSFSPPSARDEFLALAGTGDGWCLSHQVWAGLPVPASRCLDCGQLAVSVADADRCGKCMGTLTPDDTVLDARFVAAVGVLTAAGWPATEGGTGALAANTTLVVSHRGMGGWALPVAVLAVRLTGDLPFCRVVVHDVATEYVPLSELVALIESEGPAAVRVGLVSGSLEAATDGAHGLLAAAADPPGGVADLALVAAACEAAYEVGEPASALAAIGAALSEGVARGSGPSPAALLAPITGVA